MAFNGNRRPRIVFDKMLVVAVVFTLLIILALMFHG
jgi:hypothetical protein